METNNEETQTFYGNQENSVEKAIRVEKESANVEVLSSQASEMEEGHDNKNDENHSDTSDTMKEDEPLNHNDKNDMRDIGDINKPFLNICTQQDKSKSEKSDQVLTEGYPDLLVAAMVIFAALLWFNC